MKFRKLMSLLLVVLCLSLAVTAFASAAGNAFQYDAEAPYETYEFEALTITDVEYADPTATDSTLVSSITRIVYEGGEIAVDSEKYNAVLTVDGVQKSIQPGTYEGAVVVELVSKTQAESGFSKFDNAHVTTTYYNTAAAVIANNQLIRGYSAQSALIGGETTDTASTGVKVDSDGGFFSGYYITGSNYAIDGLKMSLSGPGGDDFQGWGAGIVVTDGANVTLSNSLIQTKGVIRTAIWVGGTDSVLDAHDVVVLAFNEDSATAYSLEDNYAVPMMEKVPFALGLAGNIRATNVLGSGTAKYTNSIVVSNVWGSLSTDSGRSGTDALIVTDTLSGIGTLEVAQEGKEYTATKTVGEVLYGFTVGTAEGKSSGYVTYADAGVNDWFYGVDFYAPDYIGIIASGTSNMHFDENCHGWSARCGFLIHQNRGNAENGGGLYITGGKYEVEDQFVLVKGGSINGSYTTTNVEVDGAEVSIFGDNAQSGVFFQLMQNDDAGSPGATEYTINDLSYEEMVNADVQKEVEATTGTFSNMTINGDIYNSVSGVKQDLDVTLDNVVINGTVSSAYQYHVDENGDQVNNTTIYSISSFANDWNTDYLYMGRIVNVPAAAVNNGLNLTLKNGTVWTVDEPCYLTSLTIDETSSILAAADEGEEATLYVLVDGEEVQLAPGTYEGTIVISNQPIPVSFYDVSVSDWYYKYVTELAEDGIINGYPDGSFRPNETVTYGEALKLCASASGIPYAEGDIRHWATGYLAIAQERGLFTDGVDLDAAITRKDAAMILATFLDLKSSVVSPFADTDSAAAIALYDAGIVDGYVDEDGLRTFQPEATLTRGELAKLVHLAITVTQAQDDESELGLKEAEDIVLPEDPIGDTIPVPTDPTLKDK